MAIKEPTSLITQDEIRKLARDLDALPHGERGKLITSFANQYGWGKATIYRKLDKVGWVSGRKPRSDRGNTSQDMETVQELSTLLKYGIRKNGKATMHTPTARSILAQNGRDFEVSNSRINSLLKAHQMGLDAHKKDTPHQEQKSLYPNHVHLVDPSLCLLYYLPNGKQKIINDSEAYKNKPETLEKIGHLKVWRYVLTDHYSGTIIVKYYQSKGESQANLFDFLLYCWQKQKGRPFHGVPEILYWDKGSANTAKAIKNALSSLGVKPIAHEAGRARAKGSVEKANDLVETHFECRLKAEPVTSLEELNSKVENWCRTYNQNLDPEYDSRLKRPNMAEPRVRFDMWQTIHKVNKLRELPDPELCRYLLSADPVERAVKPNLTVTFNHPSIKKTLVYSVQDVPGVFIGQKLKVSPLVYGHGEILIHYENYQGEEQTLRADPVEYDEYSGFPVHAAVIGQEMKSKPDTCIERASKAADQIAFPGKNQQEIEKANQKGVTPFEGKLNAHSYFADLVPPSYLNYTGSQIDIPDRANVQIQPLTIVEVCKRLVAEVGQVEGINFYQWVSQQYPDGVTEDKIPDLVEQIKQHTQPATSSTGLKVVANNSTHKS